jgi:hypothetical protein
LKNGRRPGYMMTLRRVLRLTLKENSASEPIRRVLLLIAHRNAVVGKREFVRDDFNVTLWGYAAE